MQETKEEKTKQLVKQQVKDLIDKIKLQATNAKVLPKFLDDLRVILQRKDRLNKLKRLNSLMQSINNGGTLGLLEDEEEVIGDIVYCYRDMGDDERLVYSLDKDNAINQIVYITCSYFDK